MACLPRARRATHTSLTDAFPVDTLPVPTAVMGTKRLLTGLADTGSAAVAGPVVTDAVLKAVAIIRAFLWGRRLARHAGIAPLAGASAIHTYASVTTGFCARFCRDATPRGAAGAAPDCRAMTDAVEAYAVSATF